MSEVSIHWCGPTHALVRRPAKTPYQTVGEHIASLIRCSSEKEGTYWKLITVDQKEIYRGEKDEAIRKALTLN